MKETNNIILTGPPRSGTTLTCFLLNKLPNTIALHEPMNLKMFPNEKNALENIDQFFSEMRASALDRGTIIAKVKEGKIPDNPFGKKTGSKRHSLVQRKEVAHQKDIDESFQLAIKHNAHFTYLLNKLTLKYPCYAIVRNPLSMIASWNSISAPVSKGNLTVLKGLRPSLYAYFETIPELLDRQVQLAHNLFAQYSVLSSDQIIYYEDIIQTGGAILEKIIPSAGQLKENLENKNKNSLYEKELMLKIAAKLVQSEGPIWNYFSKPEISNFLDSKK